MSFQVINLNMNSSPKDCYYIFDSNVLLPQLGLPDPEGLYNQYLSFLSKVMKLATSKDDSCCKIILSPVQISEVFNKLIRYRGRIHWDKSSEKQEGLSFGQYYKEVFRKSDDFDEGYKTIKSDFEEFEDASVVRNVEQSISFQDCITFDSKKLDYNDNYLYQLAKETGTVLVSHDKDFYGLEGLTLGTFNGQLYQRYKDDVFLRAKMAKFKKR